MRATSRRTRGSSSLAAEGPSLPNRLSGASGQRTVPARYSRIAQAASRLDTALRHGYQPRVLLPLTGAISVTEMANCRTTLSDISVSILSKPRTVG